jgi:DNA-binding NarL/FixJ family response regulator
MSSDLLPRCTWLIPVSTQNGPGGVIMIDDVAVPRNPSASSPTWIPSTRPRGYGASDGGKGAAVVQNYRPGGPAVRPRVCVVDSRVDGPAYGRLDECDLEIMAVLPRLGEVSLPMVRTFDLIIVGCNESLLQNPAFERRVSEVVQYTRLLGVAPNPSPEVVAHAARVGFHGFVAREVEPDAFTRAVNAVIRGELAFPRGALVAVVRLFRRAYRRSPKTERGSELTARQRQIVELIAQGANDREIADALQISQSTVHKHVQNALKRTKTRTRSHLAAAIAQPS